MAKNRAITGFGPTPLSVTNSTGVKAGTLVKLGPFNAALLGAQFLFGTATSGAIVKLQACVTTGSTKYTTLMTQTGNNSGTYKFSTATGVYSFVRVYSSAKGSTSVASNAITAHVNALG